MTAAPIRLVLVAAAALALGFADADGCGYTPEDRKGEGEPCTRTDECASSLECRGGVCMPRTTTVEDAGPGFDAGRGDLDAGRDAGHDAGGEAGDAGDLAAAAPDAAATDASGPGPDAATDEDGGI